MLFRSAALTRSYVEADLAPKFDGTVRYAKDAFEGLSLMDALMTAKRDGGEPSLPPLRERRTPVRQNFQDSIIDTKRSDVASDNPLPRVPFYGSRLVKGIPIQDYLGYLDERALFVGQWGLSGARGQYEEMAEKEGRPRLRQLVNEALSQSWLNAAVVYGYFPCYSEGNDLVILHHDPDRFGQERLRFTFPRQRRDRRLCISDFFRPKEIGRAHV